MPYRKGFFCVAAAEGVAEVISVKEVDLLVAENGPLHHTEQYDVMEREKDSQLVVRRGQAFSVSITLSRTYNADNDAVSFIFTVHGEISLSVRVYFFIIRCFRFRPNKEDIT
jgi:hypothetical protein